MNDLFKTFKNLGPSRIAILGVMTVVLLGFFIYLASRMTNTNMSLLYSDLSPADGSAIISRLESMNILYDATMDGSQIYVPADEVGRVRMSVAADGLPSGGSVGYEIFNDSDNFGTTNFVQNINHLRALEGELARTISTLSQIQNARVHLVLPKRELFNRQEQRSTASVFIKPRPGVSLTRQQILAIQHLVAMAVPQLAPKQISVIDDKGNLLARGGANPQEDIITDAKEQKIALEMRLTETIESLLGRSLGYGKIRAEVNAALNFDQIQTNIESYDPDGQVVRSTQTVEEITESQSNDSNQGVSVTNNIPGAAEDASGATNNEKANRIEETVNFEITKTITSRIQEIGEIKRLSVAVLVDGVYQTAADGTQTYQPRSEEELGKIESLVQSAIGFDSQRGDTIEVVNMQFSNETELSDVDEDPNSFMNLVKRDMVRVTELVILGAVSILIMLLVVRPILMRLLERPKEMKQLSYPNEPPPELPANATAEQIEKNTEAQLAYEKAESAENIIEQMLDINQVEGKVRASSIKKVGEIIKQHPSDAVNIIRGWMNQES